MKAWEHLMCGKVSMFPDDVNPNSPEQPCPKCKLLMGGWAPA